MATDPTPDNEKLSVYPRWVSSDLISATRNLWQTEFGEQLAEADLKDLLLNVEGLFTILFDEGDADEND